MNKKITVTGLEFRPLAPGLRCYMTLQRGDEEPFVKGIWINAEPNADAIWAELQRVMNSPTRTFDPLLEKIGESNKSFFDIYELFGVIQKIPGVWNVNCLLQ
ncbi:MAG: hypothetical protein WCJ81_07580 [bacterium]